ncbi:hypothetical protein UCRPC4_g05900 [Phaeomoniella chlamydospora]|uniref:Uncharacterized protein n=1 Tax=Phaeomoniella chlamydospora TaxID=158046 RepID=A0A0G2FXR2_PHACM|nr:hypothetical protein UCRPC4_g05900 [Phaeomoniella chlamydospora]
MSGQGYDETVAAKASLLSLIGPEGLVLEPGFCRHSESGDSIAKVCNRGSEALYLGYSAVQAAFDVLTEACSANKASGTLKTSDRTFYSTYVRTGDGATSTVKRGTRTNHRHKRCTVQTNLPVIGCEDTACDPAETLDASGNCPWQGNDDTDGCNYYCEIKATKYFGAAETLDDTSFCSVSFLAVKLERDKLTI